jgi:hypothetical protein
MISANITVPLCGSGGEGMTIFAGAVNSGSAPVQCHGAAAPRALLRAHMRAATKAAAALIATSSYSYFFPVTYR